MTMTLDLLNHPRVCCEEETIYPGATRYMLRYDMEGWGLDLIGYYWQEPRPTDLHPRVTWDGWRYLPPPQIEQTFGHPYSAPSKKSCEIQLLRLLIDAGPLAPVEDNSHLDERNQEIASEITRAWNGHLGMPRVGDFVQMPNGTQRRCAHAWDDGMQTCDGGSFSISTSGRASMSGSLYPSQLWDYFKDTGHRKKGRFWFFSHGRAGAGRGVDFYLPCRVYRLEPFEMTEAEARSHPAAIKAAEFWGEGHQDHLKVISGLMKPAALRGGYC